MSDPALKLDQNRNAVQALRPVVYHNITFNGTSQVTAAFTGHVVRLVSTAPCWIDFGTAPTASAGKTYLPSSHVEYFTVDPGMKLAVVMVSGAGDLNIAEMF